MDCGFLTSKIVNEKTIISFFVIVVVVVELVFFLQKIKWMVRKRQIWNSTKNKTKKSEKKAKKKKVTTEYQMLNTFFSGIFTHKSVVWCCCCCAFLPIYPVHFSLTVRVFSNIFYMYRIWICMWMCVIYTIFIEPILRHFSLVIAISFIRMSFCFFLSLLLFCCFVVVIPAVAAGCLRWILNKMKPNTTVNVRKQDRHAAQPTNERMR